MSRRNTEACDCDISDEAIDVKLPTKYSLSASKYASISKQFVSTKKKQAD
jgi:hypothetical protein